MRSMNRVGLCLRLLPFSTSHWHLQHLNHDHACFVVDDVDEFLLDDDLFTHHVDDCD